MEGKIALSLYIHKVKDGKEIALPLYIHKVKNGRENCTSAIYS